MRIVTVWRMREWTTLAAVIAILAAMAQTANSQSAARDMLDAAARGDTERLDKLIAPAHRSTPRTVPSRRLC
jgi:hypothetical protein